MLALWNASVNLFGNGLHNSRTRSLATRAHGHQSHQLDASSCAMGCTARLSENAPSEFLYVVASRAVFFLLASLSVRQSSVAPRSLEVFIDRRSEESW